MVAKNCSGESGLERTLGNLPRFSLHPPLPRAVRTPGGRGGEAGRHDVTIPKRCRVVFVFPALGKSGWDFSTWPVPTCVRGDPTSLLKALPSCAATGADISEAVLIPIGVGQREARPEGRNHQRRRQAPSGDLGNTAVHHEVPI